MSVDSAKHATKRWRVKCLDYPNHRAIKLYPPPYDTKRCTMYDTREEVATATTIIRNKSHTVILLSIPIFIHHAI